MKRKRRTDRRASRLDNILELPKEITTNEPKITMVGFEEMLIENYKGILEYEDFYIRINTYIGILNINGFNLKLNQMTGDDIMITGNIESVDLESSSEEDKEE
ncbi:MAG: sporulation protein YqfC [Clostridia bacterium]